MDDNLISRVEVIKLIDKYGYINCYNSQDFEANNRVDKIRQKVIELPTVYDMKSVIEQLEEKRDYYYSEMENTSGHCVGIFNEYHNKGMAFNEAIEILKSNVNIANGKNGD